jgi:hypothetical protein
LKPDLNTSATSTTPSYSENANSNIYEWGLKELWWGRWDLLPAVNGGISRNPLFSRKRALQEATLKFGLKSTKPILPAIRRLMKLANHSFFNGSLAI